MSDCAYAKDLIVLVADKSIECAVRGLLSRPESLGIRSIIDSSDIYCHPERDPACLRKANNFLKPYASTYRYALVLFDREGCGKENLDRTDLETEVETSLSNSGWSDRAAAIAIDPELENWVWSDSPEVDRVLGWSELLTRLRPWIKGQGFSFSGGKPDRPKEAMEAAIKHVRKSYSSSMFEQLAKCVSFKRCTDEAFKKLCEQMRTWFPA